MLRKLLSGLFSLILMFTLATFCFLFAFQLFFSPSNLTQLAKNLAFKELDKANYTYQEMAHEYFDDTLRDMNISPDVIDYFETKEVEAYFEKVLGENIKNVLYGSKEMSFYKDDLENLFDNAVSKYEDKTGKKVDQSAVKEAIDSLDDTEIIDLDDVDDEVVSIIKLLSNKTLLIVLGLAIIIIMVIIYLLKQDLASSLKGYGIVFIFNTIGLYLVVTLINIMIKKEMEVSINPVLELLKQHFNTLTIISLVLTVVLIVSSIILKKNQKRLPGNIENNAI